MTSVGRHETQEAVEMPRDLSLAIGLETRPDAVRARPRRTITRENIHDIIVIPLGEEMVGTKSTPPASRAQRVARRRRPPRAAGGDDGRLESEIDSFDPEQFISIEA